MMTTAVVLKHIALLQEDVVRSESRPSAEDIVARLDRIADLVRSLDNTPNTDVADPPKRGRPRKSSPAST